MAINFDLSICNQITEKFESLEASIYRGLYHSSRKVSWIRFTGLPVGALIIFLDCARIVAVLGEALIKGLCNSFGSPFSNKCSFTKGLDFTFKTPVVCVVAIPVFLVIDTVDAFVLGYQVWKDPVGVYGNKLIEKDHYAHGEVFLRRQVNENDPATICSLGNYLSIEDRTEEQLEEAENLFRRAIELNCHDGHKGLSEIYRRRGMNEQADEHLRRYNEAVQAHI